VKRATAQSYRELNEEQERRVQKLQRSSLVIDAIGSSIVSPEPPIKEGKSYVERALEAGVNVLNVTLAAHADGLDRFLDQAADYFDLFDARPESTLHVETVADITKAQQSGKLGVIFGVQTGSFVGTDMYLWTIAHKIGCRMAQLTYNERNLLGDGCLEPENRGLTSYGRQSIQEMTARGGVMGLSPHSMLSHKVPGVRANVDDLMDMFDYAVDLIGIDHVAVGSDIFESFTKLSWETTTKRWYPSGFLWETMAAEGFSSISEWPNVTRGLVARGYKDEDIAKILGGNWLRLFKEVWAA
jgi:membrane dipeptidase